MAWYRDGEFHSFNDEPAIVFANGDQEWYQDGMLHRDNDLPAIVFANGDQEGTSMICVIETMICLPLFAKTAIRNSTDMANIIGRMIFLQ